MHNPETQMEQLSALGVSDAIARRALQLFPDNMEEAANWCLDSASRHKAACLRDHVAPAALTEVFDLVSEGACASLCEN